MTCPISIKDYPKITLAHGAGGSLTGQLIEKMFLPMFDNPALALQHDGAVLGFGNKRLALTTDSYVVQPLFFPGGNIGSLAVYGTVNDLAMCGARPLYLSAGFILEEGLAMETLWQVIQAMKEAAFQANVQLVTGDTKVVEHGKGDGIFINTSGVGILEHELLIAPQSVRSGDVILLSGDIGRHGMAIMAVREGLTFESAIESDLAPLAEVVLKLLDARVKIHCLRDLTRGGLANALNEIAKTAGLGIHIREESVPVRQDVRAACEILGLDPFYVANEGRFIAFVRPDHAQRALQVMKSYGHNAGQSEPQDLGARVIGVVNAGSSGIVTLQNKIGTRRILDRIAGEQLPRIC
ncbi:MAG: hydrogenase expression/formation protein HypE [Candidatus Omnitrophica bacterium]|nr:hydrogenase expression/formation protein HypE [Candidatus Omnitrophota bacterium]